MLVEKRVAGIIRWLERLKKSYSSGALESALMDAECARADLENLRLAVWEKVKPENSSRPKIAARISARIMNVAKYFVLAGIIVMVYVFPISKEVKAPELVFWDKPENMMELDLTLAEARDDTLTLKEEAAVLATKDTQADMITMQKTKVASLPKSEVQAAAKKMFTKKAPAPVSTKRSVASKPSVREENSRVRADKSVAYDKVFSLVQTGQRALKNNNSVVKVK